MNRFIIVAFAVGSLFMSRLSAQCSGSDVAAYWDNSFDASYDPPIVDYWNITDGDGCDDGCGGTIQYWAHATISDAAESYLLDGGAQSETVPETSPGFARSDASGSPPDATDLTYSGNGYAYICGCSSCFKLATFAFSSVLSLHTSYYQTPIIIGSGPGVTQCSYGALACTSGSATCQSQGNVFGWSFQGNCPSMVKVGYLVTGSTCLVGIAHDATGQVVRVCT